MEPGSFVDTESIRDALGDRSFESLERKLQDRWAAQVYASRQKMEKVAAASQRLEIAANDKLGGLRPRMNMDYAMWAWLNLHYPGWQSDPSFLKDLFRFHPETEVKERKAPNKVGWTSSLNARTGASRMETRGRGDAETRRLPLNDARLVLTDRRGNAA